MSQVILDLRYRRSSRNRISPVDSLASTIRLSLLALALPLVTARVLPEVEKRCLSLNEVCIEPGASIVSASYNAYRNNVDIWDIDLNITRLPPSCQLQVDIVTNENTGKRVCARVWLPEDWNRRLLAFGQGGIGLVGHESSESFVLFGSCMQY